jgi:hypothetical protein
LGRSMNRNAARRRSQRRRNSRGAIYLRDTRPRRTPTQQAAGARPCADIASGERQHGDFAPSRTKFIQGRNSQHGTDAECPIWARSVRSRQLDYRAAHYWGLFIAGHGLHVLLERASLSAQSSLSGKKTCMEWLRSNALNLTIRFFVNAAAFSYWMHLRTQRRARLDLWASQRTLHLSQVKLRQQRSGFQAIV